MLRSLRTNEEAATVVEFGLLLPVILGSFCGVLQVGIGMLSYNSLRNLTAETSRYALVEYQSSNEITNEMIEADGIARAPDSGLDPNRFTIDVDSPDDQRIEGATELTITANYLVPTVLPFLGIDDFTVSFSRPIFLINEEDTSEDGSELDDTETGTDFGEGGTDTGSGSGTGTDTGTTKQCSVSGNCDHEHKST